MFLFCSYSLFFVCPEPSLISNFLHLSFLGTGRSAQAGGVHPFTMLIPPLNFSKLLRSTFINVVERNCVAAME